MSIRTAIEQDAANLAELVSSLAHFYLDTNTDTLPQWFAETLTQAAFVERIGDRNFQNFVYELEGQLLAYIALKGGSHLYHLFVSESSQGQGIARQLWGHAQAQCPSKHYSVRASINALAVYKRFGFVEVGLPGSKEGIRYQTMELSCD